MSELVVRGLQKSFGATEVLRGVDLVVPSGSITAVLGPSGCGKTTLLRLLAGFDRADAGEIDLAGRTVTAARTFVPPEKRRVGMVPQEGALFGHLDVAGNVAFGLRRKDGRREARVGELLDLVGLRGYERRMPAELSGGQQQRVALARALAPEPAIVLLDEPFSALDAGLRASVRADVVAALRTADATAILVTHDQEEALSTADQVAVLTGGVIVQSATPRDLYWHPVDAEVAAFVGEANLVNGSVVDGALRTELGTLDLVRSATPLESGAVGSTLIRPEQLRLGARGVPARVVDTEFFGHDAVVQIDLAGQRLRARTQGFLPADGEQVRVTVVGPVTFFPSVATSIPAGSSDDVTATQP
ncbi:MAG: ABC transporter ATP-binding protein [Nocardioidaceae bacterium]